MLLLPVEEEEVVMVVEVVAQADIQVLVAQVVVHQVQALRVLEVRQVAELVKARG